MAVPATPDLSPRTVGLPLYLQRLIWLGVAPLMLGVLALMAYDLQREHTQRTDQVRHLALEAKHDLDVFVRQSVHSLQAMALMTHARNPTDLERMHERARAYQRAIGTHVALIDANGRRLLYTRLSPGTALPVVTMPEPQAGIARMFRGGEPVVGDLVTGPLFSQSMVIVSTPLPANAQVIGNTDKLRLGWMATVTRERLEQLLAHLPLPATWSITLRDSQSLILAARGPLTAAVANAEASAHHVVVPLSEAPWTVALHAQPRDFYSPMLHTAAFLLIGLALTTGWAWWTARRAGTQLGGVVAALSDPALSHAAPGAPQPRIEEIGAARQQLLTLEHAREQAVHQCISSEERHVESLRRSVAQLKQARSRMRVIFDAASEAICITDEQLTILEANAVTAEMAGTSIRQLIGAHLLDMAPSHQREKQMQAFRRLRENAERTQRATHRGRLTMLRTNGTPLLVESVTTCVRLGDEFVFVILARDVTNSVQQARALGKAHADLARAHDALHQLNTAQRHAEERERQRIARELHDGLQQQLGVVQMKLDLITRQTRDAADAAAELAVQARHDIEQAIESIRRIVNDLRPRALDELGLVAALRQLSDEVADLTGLQIELDIVGDTAAFEALSEAARNAIYRLVQESLTNVRKHAQASFVYLLLDASDAQRLHLLVSDDGRGMGADDLAKADSFGLRSMCKRVQRLRGTLQVRRGHGNDETVGTTIVVELPLGAADDGSPRDR